jgi:hypothetical protein
VDAFPLSVWRWQFVLDPAITDLLTRLGEVAARNTASAIRMRIDAAKASKQNDATINELNDIINELLNDRSQLVGIATDLKEQLVAQRITDEDIKYITDTLIPTVEQHAERTGEVDGDTIATIKTLVSVETLTVLQLIGFNYKAAIGEPLTEVVQGLILQLAPKPQGAGQKAPTGQAKRR